MSFSMENYTHIPIKDLIVGRLYVLKARNLRLGYWDGKVFNGIRFKAGQYFIDTEYHYDDETTEFGTAKPLEEFEIAWKIICTAYEDCTPNEDLLNATCV